MIDSELQSYSTDELESELQRRKDKSETIKPLYDNSGDYCWDKVYCLAIEIANEFEKHKNFGEDDDYCVFALVLKTVYGEEVWEKIRGY